MIRLSPVRKSIIGVLVILALVSFVLPVLAGAASYSGALGAGDLISSRPSLNSCSGTGVSDATVEPITFWVSAPGVYRIEAMSASFDIVFHLYTPSFNPASHNANCIEGDDDDGVGLLSRLDVALLPDTPYVLLISGVNGATGSFTIEWSGSGEIAFAPFVKDATIPFTDGRINNRDQWATFAVYCPDDNIEVYAIDATGAGQLAFTTTPEEVEAVGVPSSGNVIVEEGRGVTLYRLSSGEFQLVGPRDAEWKTYNVMFTSCGLSGVVRTFMYP